MEKYILNIITVGVISWGTIFMFLRRLVLPNRSFEFCNRLVSTLHAFLAVTLVSVSVEDWMCPLCSSGSQSSRSQMVAMAVSVSYLIYDVVCCLFDTRFNLDNTIHHLVSIVGLGGGLAYKKSGTELVAALWITELSSPFLHARVLLKELGYKNTDLNLAADISFAVIFSFARMVVGPYITFVTLKPKHNPLIIKVMALGLQMVSTFWFWKIVKMIKYKFASKFSFKKLSPPKS